MNYTQSLALIQTLQPNMSLPPIRRNKSWLLVFGTADLQLVFYDVRFSLAEGFQRIVAAHAKDNRQYELIDITPFTTADEAGEQCKIFKSAYENIRFFETQCPKPPVAPLAASAASPVS